MAYLEAGEGDWRHDAAAFAALVRRWQQPVGRFLARMVGDPERVQDLCQEVFLKVYLARDRYRESDAFSTWLFQIALNSARDSLRRRQPVCTTLTHDAYAQCNSPEAECEQNEVVAQVSQALRELPLSLREVVALRHIEGMSFEDMARMTGTPASTLKSRFTVALRRLRGQLSGLHLPAEEI